MLLPLLMPGVDTNPEAFCPHSWDSLFQEALDAAQKQVSRLSWRGAKGGVLPHGYNPNSIAAQAILELLKNQPCEGASPPPLSPAQLRRAVWRQVDRLHHLAENSLTINEPDLAPTTDFDGDPARIIDLIAADDVTPLDLLLIKERDAEFEKFQADFKKRLGRQHRLKRLFDLLCDGIRAPAVLARRLKVRVQAIAPLKNRLRRLLTAKPKITTASSRNPASL